MWRIWKLLFLNGCNKVVIEPSGVQFWFGILLVISNRTHAAHSFDLLLINEI